MSIRKFTAIGRPLEMNYPTNRAILFVTAAVFLATAVLSFTMDLALLPALKKALGYSVSVFFAWAICREVDPDNDYSAFVAAGLSLAGILVYYPPDFMGMVWLMLMLRVVNRTTGLRANLSDSFIVTALAAYLMTRGDWIYGLVTVLAFVLDSLIKPIYRRQLYFAALNAVLLAMVWIFIGFNTGKAEISLMMFLPGSIIILLFIPYIFLLKEMKSKGDDTGLSLSAKRVKYSALLSLITVILFYFFEGNQGVEKMIILWAVIAAVSIYLYFNILKSLFR